MLRVSPTLARDCARLNSDTLPRASQSEVLGFSYAEVSAALMQQWLIPDSLVSTIAMQHHEDIPAITVEAQLIQLAYMLAIIQTRSDFFSIEYDLPPFLYECLNISEEDCSSIIENCEEQYLSLASIFKT